jgi:hypothetical protein
MADHQEQFARVKRYYERFKKLSDGMEHVASTDNYLDDVYAFFQNAHHMKDWLKNDAAFTKYTNQEIEHYVKITPALAICADICNSTKHLVLFKKLRSGVLPSIGHKEIFIDLTEEISFSSTPPPPKEHPVKIAMKIAIQHGTQSLNAFGIATDAVAAWESFIN